MNFVPLLTIAIPTYNRASILDEALKKLLPQILKHKDEIEFIISDNASTDRTQEVIIKYKEEFSDLNFITFLQSENTGYFGNFKKCKELSSGKYFWLLSDNEHILMGVIDYLMTAIYSNNNDVGVYYFENKSILKQNLKTESKSNFNILQTNFENLVEKGYAYTLTGISSVVFLNTKEFDSNVIEKYNGNPFLGFFFLCNALRVNTKIDVINGEVYTSAPCYVYFDIFRAWTKDITECVEYMVISDLLTEKSKIQFVTGYLEKNLYALTRLYRINGNLHGKMYGSIKELNKLLNAYYIDYPYYKKHILPLFYPTFIFKINVLIGKIRRRIEKYFFYSS